MHLQNIYMQFHLKPHSAKLRKYEPISCFTSLFSSVHRCAILNNTRL